MTPKELGEHYEWIDTLTYSKKTLKRFRRAYRREERAIMMWQMTCCLIVALLFMSQYF